MGFEVWRRKIWTHWNYLRREHQAGERPWSTDFQRSSGPDPAYFTHLGDYSQGLHRSSSWGAYARHCRGGYPLPALRASLQCLPRPTRLDYVRGREGRKEGCWHLLLVPVRGTRLGDRESVYQPQELKSSEVIS